MVQHHFYVFKTQVPSGWLCYWIIAGSLLDLRAIISIPDIDFKGIEPLTNEARSYQTFHI